LSDNSATNSPLCQNKDNVFVVVVLWLTSGIITPFSRYIQIDFNFEVTIKRHVTFRKIKFMFGLLLPVRPKKFKISGKSEKKLLPVKKSPGVGNQFK